MLTSFFEEIKMELKYQEWCPSHKMCKRESPNQVTKLMSGAKSKQLKAKVNILAFNQKK